MLSTLKPESKLNIKLYILFLFISGEMTAQSIFKKAVVGVVRSDTFLFKQSTNCNFYSNRSINQAEMVVIVDAKICSYDRDSVYYLVAYDSALYHMKSKTLILSGGDLEKIQAMHILDRENLVDSVLVLSKYLKISGELDQIEKKIAKMKPFREKGICILDWTLSDESEYTSGTSIEISVYNPTKKNIKYIYFGFTGYNAVDDVIVEGGKSQKFRTGVGPILPDESGTYNFDYVWFTDLVHTARITSLKVKYMDGTVKVISNPKSVIYD